jgi:hypothetical protein
MPNFVMDGTGTICILSGRTYTKVNPGRAIVGVAVNSGGHIGPLLVSEMADAVTYSATSGGPWPYESTILHKGVTYYVNAGAHFMGGNPADTSGLDRYRCSAAGLDAAAEELLNAYEHSNIPTAGQIADYTGAVYNKTGKLYHFDGTALSQIGKVYGYDGTALHPIYSAEEFLLDGSNLYTDITGGWTKTWGNRFETHEYGLLLVTGAGWGTGISTVNTIKNDGFTKLNCLVQLTGTGSFSNRYINYGGNEWNVGGAYGLIENTTAEQTVTLNVAGVASGQIHINLTAADNATGDKCNLKIKKIWFE